LDVKWLNAFSDNSLMTFHSFFLFSSNHVVTTIYAFIKWLQDENESFYVRNSRKINESHISDELRETSYLETFLNYSK
jgi:hypothetical protein